MQEWLKARVCVIVIYGVLINFRSLLKLIKYILQKKSNKMS